MTRLRALDGLRGIAALVVVVHHCLLTSIVLAATYRGGTTKGWGLSELLTRTPLHLLWDGTGVVLIFFVLSGFVLTLAFTRKAAPGGSGPGWSNYYAKRFPRLYLPVWGSLVLAVAIAELVPRLATDSQSWWINAHAAAPTAAMVARDASLLWNPSLLNSPLWSLQWEAAFSLLLPVYVWIAVRRRGQPWLSWVKVAIALVLVGIGSKSGHASLLYLPVFALGVILASERDRLTPFFAPWDRARWGGRAWWALALLAVFLLTIDWMAGPFAEWISRPLRSAGAGLVVVLFLYCRRVGAFADARVLQWLGRISFSLYLVHEPIVVSVDRLLPGSNPLEVLSIALPVSLAVAAAFYRLVERPSLAVSRWCGRLESKPSDFWRADLRIRGSRWSSHMNSAPTPTSSTFRPMPLRRAAVTYPSFATSMNGYGYQFEWRHGSRCRSRTAQARSVKERACSP